MNTKKLFGIFLCFIPLLVMSQSMYCYNYVDFVANNWNALDTVKVEFKSILSEKAHKKPKTTSKYASNTVAYLPDAGSEELSTNLWKEARFVKNTDSLYFNCRGLMYQGKTLGNCFVPVLNVSSTDNILFVLSEHNQNVYKTKFRNIILASSWLYVGLMGLAFLDGAMNANSKPSGKKPIYGKKTYCYVFNMPSEQVARVDDRYMRKILSANPALLDEYISANKHERLTAESVMYYFGKMGLLE